MAVADPEATAQKEDAEAERREYRDMYRFYLSAANMTRKLDASSALSEYEILIRLLEGKRAAGERHYDDLHAQCQKAFEEAQERVKHLALQKPLVTRGMPSSPYRRW